MLFFFNVLIKWKNDGCLLWGMIVIEILENINILFLDNVFNVFGLRNDMMVLVVDCDC